MSSDLSRAETPPSRTAAWYLTRNHWLSQEFRENYHWLTASVRRLVYSHEDAEDLAASAFTELAEHGDPSSIRQPRAFLTTVLRRLTFEFWRRRDLERSYLGMLERLPQYEAPSAEALASVVEDIARIDRVLGSLPAKARESFILSQFEGLTYAEIGTRLGVSASMVRKYVADALIVCAFR